MNEKELMEKRNDLQAKMEEILNKAKVENRAMNDEEIKSFDDVEKEIKNIEKKLSRLDSKELRAKEAYIDGIDTIEEYRANKERISQERTELEEQLAKLTQVPEEPEDNTRKMLQSISSILDILQSDSFTPQEKNAALKSIVEKITYDRANSHIDVDFYLTENPEMPANP